MSVVLWLHTHLPTYSVEQSSSWEANRFAASQEIPHILRNPKVHYLTRKCPPSVHILSKLDQVRNLTSHFLKIHLIIIVPSTPGSPKLLFPSNLRTKILHMPLYSPISATWASLILLDFITRKVLGEEYRRGVMTGARYIIFKVILFTSKMHLSKYVDKVMSRMTEELGFHIWEVGFVYFVEAQKPDLRPKQILLRWIPVALSLWRWRGQGLGLSTLYTFQNTRIMGHKETKANIEF